MAVYSWKRSWALSKARLIAEIWGAVEPGGITAALPGLGGGCGQHGINVRCEREPDVSEGAAAEVGVDGCGIAAELIVDDLDGLVGRLADDLGE